MGVDRYVPGVGQVDVSDQIRRAFHERRVVAIDQRDWHVVIKLRCDDGLGPVTLEELDDLAHALRLDRTAVTIAPLGRVRDALEVVIDLEVPTPVDDPRKSRSH